MVRFIKWLAVLLILLLGGLVGAYYLAKKYEEPVRNYIVGEVNKRLQSPVHVSDINFSLLARFPSASLVMDSVWAEENIIKIGDADTLFFFNKVYLNLNIFDIIAGQYKINEIETKGGFLNLLVDENGYDNYHIWVQSKDTTGFLLELDRVHIQETEFRYQNLVRRQDFQIYADDLFFKGRFSEESYTMAVSGEGLVHDINIKGTSYLIERQVVVETDMDVITESQRFDFKSGELLIDDLLDFQISGSMEGDGVDLHIIGSDLDVIRSLALIPSESRSALDQYESTGRLTFDCILRGAFGRTENPGLTANFSIINGAIKKKGSDWRLTDLNGSGSLTNGSSRNFSTTKIDLLELVGKLNEQEFKAGFSVENLKSPTIIGNGEMTTDLEAIKDFFNLESLEEANGKLYINANIATTLNDAETPTARDFLNAKASGFIRIADANFQLKDDQRRYAIDSADFSIVDNTLDILYYKGALNDCKIDIDGKAKGFLDYFFTEDGMLDVTGNIRTSTINLDALFPSQSESQSGVVVGFPKRATWDLSIDAEGFQLGKFEANEIKGRLIMDGFKIEASKLSFESLGGQVQGKVGVYRFGENQLGIRTDFSTAQVDVKSLFSTFNNFDQKFITSDFIEGNVDATIQFQSFCDSMLNVQKESIVASADLRITNGALTNFQPLINVADELKKKRMLRLFVSTEELKKRLEHVEFDTLQNQISIRNQVVTIPDMMIRSSAIDMDIRGTHSFDNQIDYKMEFALSELLELKDRKEPYNEYVRRDKKGNTRIALRMSGTTDDFTVELEESNIEDAVREEIKQERLEVKGILKEEFGWYKDDSTAVAPIQKEKDIKIEFNPEGEPGQSTDTLDSSTPEEQKDKNEKLLNRWLKKAESDKKKLKDGDFEDDDF